LLIHAGLGLFCLILFFRFNAHTYRPGWAGAAPSVLEWVYYFFAVGSVCVGWYFNIQYVMADPAKASWVDFTEKLFTNPAAGSGSQDLITTNTFLFPLWTIVDGPRRGMKHCWIYFVLSLFTSFGFAMGLYLAALERQLRWLKANAAQ
jgi:hypothetical protein